MAILKTRRGKIHYKPINLFLGINQINKEIAFQNLNDIAKILRKHNIPLTPCYGTLLGIIRDHDFIEWDEDIDLMVLNEKKDDLLDALWDMKDIGFKFIREDRCDHILTVMREGEYIDFYIMDSISPEIRTDYSINFFFEKHLSNLIEWDFNGLQVMVPKDYDEFLSFLYGDWKTPVRYVPSDLNSGVKNIRKIKQKLKQMLPHNLHFWLLKKYHAKDLERFRKNCKDKGITLKYPIKW